tara:strand:+ start:3777 stop:4823 length:1047 start_codon:yes stop_codon:yes gene_type:complete
MNNWNKKSIFLLVLFMMSLNFYGVLQSQTIQFIERTGDENPLENVTTVSSTISSPVDIDNDGDFDLFIGNSAGAILFYKNIGTEENPNLFEEQIGVSNPLSSVDLSAKVLPVFVDIDGDLDLDVFLGGKNKVVYYKNTGSISNPVFQEQLEENNPLNSVTDLGNRGYFTSFVDIDYDDDLDAFIGWIDFNLSDSQGILFYENKGSTTTPSFHNKTGDENPFQSFNELYPIPTFVDIDGDADLDVFLEKGNGSYLFYENTTETITVGIENVFIDPVAMYPNPAKSEVTFNVLDNETKVRVFSMSGLEIYRTLLTKEKRTIDVHSFDSGIYLILIESGGLKLTKKLVVKK